MWGITKMCKRDLSAFSTTCRCIRQRCKKCMSWRFIAWSIQNWATQPLWDNGTARQQASHMFMVCSSKNTYMFLIFSHSEMRLIPIGSWHSWTKWQTLCLTTVTIPSHQCNDMSVRFLYSTFNILCGSLNKLFTVWQCTEILLYTEAV